MFRVQTGSCRTETKFEKRTVSILIKSICCSSISRKYVVSLSQMTFLQWCVLPRDRPMHFKQSYMNKQGHHTQSRTFAQQPPPRELKSTDEGFGGGSGVALASTRLRVCMHERVSRGQRFNFTKVQRPTTDTNSNSSSVCDCDGFPLSTTRREQRTQEFCINELN